MHAKSCKLGAPWQDLSADFEKEFLNFKDADMNPCSKRAAPQGTPDREANTIAKTKPETTSEALELAMPHGNLSKQQRHRQPSGNECCYHSHLAEHDEGKDCTWYG